MCDGSSRMYHIGCACGSFHGTCPEFSSFFIHRRDHDPSPAPRRSRGLGPYLNRRVRDGAAAAAGHPVPRCRCAPEVILPTTLPTSDCAPSGRRPQPHDLGRAGVAGSANGPTSSRAAGWSVRSRTAYLEARHPHPLGQWRAPVRNVWAAADAEHVPTSGASGPVRVCIHQPLWKFVGRARDPCRSTVRVSTRTRVTYSLCNVYK